MKKSRYNEELIVRILREANRDTVVDVATRHGVSEASIYAWRKRFPIVEAWGLDPSQAISNYPSPNPSLRDALLNALTKGTR